MTSRLNIINTHELKSGHKYLLVFEKGTVGREDIVFLQDTLKNMSVQSVAVAVSGDVKNVKLVDVTEQTK